MGTVDVIKVPHGDGGMQALTTPAAVRPAAGRAGADAAPRPEMAVSIRRLTKSYRHPWTQKLTRGLEPLDLDVARGEVFGYLGPTGAAKAPPINNLPGPPNPPRGPATILGEPIDRVASRRRIGFLPEHPYFYDSLTGVEYLEFVARLSGMPAREAMRAAR